MENISTEYLKELSCPTKDQGLKSELLENEGHLPHTDGSAECPDISDVIVDISKVTEEGVSINNDTSERFVSVLERRRMLRKSEEEKEIDWKVSGKVDEEEMKSKVESLLSKLKVRFSEEREARKSIVKPNRSYSNFCNSVDAFLRHIETPKIDINYSKVNDNSQGEELYSFGVRPASIGKNRKIRSFDTHVNDCLINILPTKENDDEVAEKDVDGVESVKDNSVSKEVIEPHIDHIGSDTLFDKASEFQAILYYSSSSPDDKMCPAIFTDDTLLHHEADDNILKQEIFDNMLLRGSGDNIVLQGNDGCQFNPFANDMWTYENLNPLQCGKFSPCPRDMPMFFKEVYPQNISSVTQYSPAFNRTNASIVPFTETVPFTKRHLSICGINMTVPLKYLKKIVNDYAYQFLIYAKPTSKKVYGFPADENLIGYLQPVQPIIHLLTFKDINGIISLITVMCPITKHYVLDICMKPSSKFITVGNLKPKQRHVFNICEKPTNKQLHGVSEHKISKVPQIFNLSLEDERVTNTATTADDQNVFADDSQRAGNEKIIDEWDDVGSFGIMSIYCNSEIHSGYARVPDDPPDSIQLK
ncbi:uncharacterized protein LOC132755104 [Ruditapes philippinarum]|uniref:uncharacterized protein LOC132755104 n=1 Tax=Ruditapes philippinarum TaxID=129788 RepID=UPI00295AE56E|nr:uncharacterized protein LOC132755104 [Ruditapes philippinarum]